MTDKSLNWEINELKHDLKFALSKGDLHWAKQIRERLQGLQ